MTRTSSGFEEVQAALLNSECHPKIAVQRALQAVAQFAFSEEVVDQASWRQMCEEAWAGFPRLPE